MLDIRKGFQYCIFIVFFFFAFTASAQTDSIISPRTDTLRPLKIAADTSNASFLRDSSQANYSDTIPKNVVKKSEQIIAEGITGKLIDSTTSEPLIGAIVNLEALNLGASTDLEGVFVIPNVPDGNYSLKVSYLGYKPIITKVSVVNGKSSKLNISVPQEAKTLKEIQIIGTRRTNTQTAVISEIRKSDNVVSGISSEQITKSQDRDAGEVVRRVPGVTIIDNRFIMIRGLSERYNNVLLNNALTPSAEADVKAFSFDVLPSALIDRLLIYKTPSPELPGEFAGGIVKLYTKAVTDRRELSIGYSSSIRQGSTFQKFEKLSGGKTDFLGFGNNSRKLPADFPENINTATPDEQTKAAKSLSNNWKPFSTTAIPDQRFNINYMDYFFVKGLKVNQITALNYSYTRTIFNVTRADYNNFDEKTGLKDTLLVNKDKQYNSNARLGFLNNWSIRLSNAHKIEFRNLFNQFSVEQAVFRNRRNVDVSLLGKDYAFNYTDRSLYSGQLGGVHNFKNDSINIDWTLGYSYSNRHQPDFKRIAYTRDANDPSAPFAASIAFGSPNITSTGRFNSNTEEKVKMASGNIEYIMPVSILSPKLKAGYYLEHKTRSFDSRALGYLSQSPFYGNIALLPPDSLFADSNISASPKKLYLQEITNGSGDYGASNDLLATYIALDLQITKRIKIYGGARMENNTQTLQSHSKQKDNEVLVKIHRLKILPSVNLTYNFNEKTLMRAAYGTTVNRPEFREIAPFPFYDFDNNRIIVGNSKLIPATIHNFDLRWEYYPSSSELINVGVFYKDFRNTIESAAMNATGGDKIYTFINSKSAYAAGVEFEIRKSLGFLTSNNKSQLNNLALLFNGAIIKSAVTLGDSASAIQIKNRPLQGQSPYIANGGIFYNNDSLKFQASILYNVFGPRIVFVGYYGYPDLVEKPRHTIDISISKGFGKHLEVKAGVSDLLNQTVAFVQDVNNNKRYELDKDQTIFKFKRGSYYNLGFVYRF